MVTIQNRTLQTPCWRTWPLLLSRLQGGPPAPQAGGGCSPCTRPAAWAGWTWAGARPGEMSPSAHPTATPVRLMAESMRLRDRSDMAPLQSRGWCLRAGLPRLSRRTGTHLPHCLQKPHCHPGLCSPRFSRCDTELGDPLVGPLELWRPRLHLSSDIWAAFLWQNWNSRCDPSVCFVRSFVAYDFPFTCLYIKVQMLDSAPVAVIAKA